MLPVAIVAHKEIARLSQVYVQMHVGKTMNLHQVIKHQGDIQDWKTIPAEVRKAVLEDVAREVLYAGESVSEP